MASTPSPRVRPPTLDQILTRRAYLRPSGILFGSTHSTNLPVCLNFEFLPPRNTRNNKDGQTNPHASSDAPRSPEARSAHLPPLQFDRKLERRDSLRALPALFVSSTQNSLEISASTAPSPSPTGFASTQHNRVVSPGFQAWPICTHITGSIPSESSASLKFRLRATASWA